MSQILSWPRNIRQSSLSFIFATSLHAFHSISQRTVCVAVCKYFERQLSLPLCPKRCDLEHQGRVLANYTIRKRGIDDYRFAQRLGDAVQNACSTIQTSGLKRAHSFAPLCLLDSLSLSRSSLRRILPLGLLGISSVNSTPPLSHLCRALLCSTCFLTSRMIILSFSSRPTDCAFTT